MDIIVNPTSGKDKGVKNLHQIEVFLKERNISYTIHQTKYAGHAEQIAKELSYNNKKTIVVMGGDGTFHEVLNGIDSNKSRLGFIPSGRGNDFAKSANLPLNIEESLGKIIKGIPKDFDYIQVDNRKCLNVAGTGLDVSVLKHTANKQNKITYTTSLLQCLLKYKPYNVQVELEGETKEYCCVMAAVCNGTQFGGGIKLCPPAKIDDGFMDFLIIEQPKIPALFIMPSFVKGKHMNYKIVRHVLCEKIKINTLEPIQLDGEIYTNLKFEANIVKAGVKTFA